MSILDNHLQRQIDEIIAESQRIEREIDSKLQQLENNVFYRLDFYADHFEYKNKRFSFKCASEEKAYILLVHYLNHGNRIRACFVNQFQKLYGKFILINSTRVDLVELQKHDYLI